MKIKKIIELYKNFSPEIAFWSALTTRSKSAAKWKHKYILRYLKEKYHDFILQYKNENFENTNSKTSGIIWTVWWQGHEKEDLPETVKICHESVRKNSKSHELKIITKENFKNYINLPDYIFEKVDAGIITITHLSDIIRYYLMYEYGGLWVDSSIFVANEIPESIFEAEYYTLRHAPDIHSRHVSLEQWTSFLQAARKGNVLCSFILDFFLEYWKTQDSMIDYFLIDYAVEIARQEFPKAKAMMDSVPIINYNVFKLESILNDKWDAEIFDEIKNKNLFSKLSWRKGGRKKTFSGHETIYAHLAKNLITR